MNAKTKTISRCFSGFLRAAMHEKWPRKQIMQRANEQKGNQLKPQDYGDQLDLEREKETSSSSNASHSLI